jgi:hypothetical protein
MPTDLECALKDLRLERRLWELETAPLQAAFQVSQTLATESIDGKQARLPLAQALQGLSHRLNALRSASVLEMHPVI